jgi:hypothetical protein
MELRREQYSPKQSQGMRFAPGTWYAEPSSITAIENVLTLPRKMRSSLALFVFLLVELTTSLTQNTMCQVFSM